LADWNFYKRLVLWGVAGVFLWLPLACVPGKPTPSEQWFPATPEITRQLFETLQGTKGKFHSLRGLAKVHVLWQGKDVTATQAMLVEKPDRFRAETLNPFGFGSPLLLMATDGEEMAVLVPGDGLLFRGEATSHNLWRFTKVPLSLQDLVCLMLYDVPIISYQKRIAMVNAEGEYRLILQGVQNRRQELQFNGRMQLVEVAYFLNNDLALQVKYDNFSAAAVPFPQSALMKMPLQKAEASLTFSEVATNVTATLDNFQLSTPPGYQERPIP